MTGSRPEIALRASQSKTLEEAFSWWGQSLSILGQPSFWVGAPEESWSAIGRLTLSAFGAEEPSRAAVEAKCHDLMAQTSAVIASDLARRFGKEIAGGDTIPASRPDAAGGLVFKWSLDAGPVSMEGAVVWADSLLQWCSGLTPQRSGASACSEDASEASGDETLQLGGRPVASLPRLDLRVKFVLGRATLPLGDVFKLNTGSVIELDCSTAEPADVVIHGRVLARGEVVVVNGNYGLKILPHERTTRP
jgi:flagellar motor switch protein FliN/FliY